MSPRIKRFNENIEEEVKPKYYIYTLTDPLDNDIKYIGKSINLKNRFWHHMGPSNLKDSWIPKNKWLLWLKNQGLKPEMEILEETDAEHVDACEIYWISQFKQWGFKLKNVSSGGGGADYWTGKKLSDEHILKIKTNNPMRKSVCQYEIGTDKLLGEYISTREASRITGVRKDHISKCCRDIENTAGGFYWRYKDEYFPFVKKIVKQSEESKMKSKMNNPLRKIICQYEIGTDKEYDSGHDAERETKISRRHIIKCCKGIKNFNTAGGYYWRFKDNYFPLNYSPETIGKYNKKYKK